MARPPRKSKKDLKRESLQLALTERRVFLFLTVVFALTTAISPLLGAHWPLPTGAGFGATLSGIGSYLRR
jgi:hypothetical protein